MSAKLWNKEIGIDERNPEYVSDWVPRSMSDKEHEGLPQIIYVKL